MRAHIFSVASVAAIVILISGSVFYLAPRYAGAQGTNCHIATPAEVAAGAPAGRPVCAADAAAGITEDSGQAKQYLRSILCPQDGDNYGGMGPDGTIKGLDEKFAVCAAKFLKSARDNGTNVCVREGARSVDKQNEYVRRGVLACKNGAQCEHPRGLAIDVNVRPNVNSCASYTNLHRAAPQFGLDFYLKCADAYHFRPTSAGCNAGGVVPPPGSGSLSDQIRQALGMQQPPMPPQPQLPPQPTQPPQPTLPPQSTQPPQSTTPPDPQQVPPVSGFINTNTNTSSNTNTNTQASSTGTSTFDLIEAYLNPVSDSIEIGKAVDITLNPDTKDAASLNPKKPTSATGTLATSQTLNVPQTFTSSDLANNPASFYGSGQNTFLLGILETMKNAVLFALNYLKPFGGYTSNQFLGE